MFTHNDSTRFFPPDHSLLQENRKISLKKNRRKLLIINGKASAFHLACPILVPAVLPNVVRFLNLLGYFSFLPYIRNVDVQGGLGLAPN